MLTLSKKLIFNMGMSMRFFARNLWTVKGISRFPATRFGAFVIEPFSRKDFFSVSKLYVTLNQGNQLGLQKLTVLWLLGSRLCLVARNADRNEVVGMVIYYFNARDHRDGTIHAGYIGLCKEARGKGLGTFLRRHAMENFARSGLSGVSSRVSVNNLPSLKSNQKLGFVPIETYFDPSMQEERHYLICNFRSDKYC